MLTVKGALSLAVFYPIDVRNSKGMSIRELSKLSGVAKSHIEKIEAGTTSPSVDIMCKLARALDVPVYSLFSCDHDTQ